MTNGCTSRSATTGGVSSPEVQLGRGWVCWAWKNAFASSGGALEFHHRPAAEHISRFSCRNPCGRREPLLKILIADDHGIVRTGLKLLFERVPDMQVVAEAADGREAVRLGREFRPDIVIMDIGMPLLNGID